MSHKIDWIDLRVDEKVLGWGAFGDVHKGTWNSTTDRKSVVIKKFRHCIPELDIFREAMLLSLTNHENIVKFHGSAQDEYERTVLIMEYAECGSLHNLLHRDDYKNINLPHRLCNSWMLQCAKGIEYLHNLLPKILHRDLKPQNLLLFNKCRILKICDFGTVKQLLPKMTHGIGTVLYMAPEVSEITSYTEKCDVYSFGITFWEVMSRKKPFYQLGNNVEVYIQSRAMAGDRPPLEDIQNIENSDQIINIIELCWHRVAEKRPTMQEVIQDIELLYSNDKCEDCYLNLEEREESEVNNFIVGEEQSMEDEQRDRRENLIADDSSPNLEVKWSDVKVERTPFAFGCFGDVFKATWKTKEGEKIIAVKSYRNYAPDPFTIYQIDIPCINNNENLVKFYGITTDVDGRYVKLMEYSKYGNLHDVVHNPKMLTLGKCDFKAIIWMLQCAKGVAYMHKHNIIHRDLKPRNLLLFNYFQTLKISISDLTTKMKPTMTLMSGTIDYMAPEIVEFDDYTEKCDVYSFAIILWEVMSLKKPYYQLKNTHELAKLKKALEGDRPMLNDVCGNQSSEKIKTLITSCWAAEPENRPTMNEIVMAIENILEFSLGH